MKQFIAPTVVSILALGAVYLWGGVGALLIAGMLAVLEITLSFDNAVVNAKVLSRMSELWQKRFLTWGILFAAPAISAFGGIFLLMVSLRYFFDTGKSVHWIARIERHLARWGRIEAIQLGIALTTLLLLSFLAENQAQVLVAGCIGLLTFIVMQGITSTLDVKADQLAGGAVFFVYLNVLDSAFSLDGVVGAFALTTAIPIIFVGLGIGAYFVRSITVFLVRRKTLEALRYLEHGAHWAILGLGFSMLIGVVVHVPEVVVGLIGFVFVTLAYVSSRREIARFAKKIEQAAEVEIKQIQ